MTGKRSRRDDELEAIKTVGRTLRYRREDIEHRLADERERRA